MQTPEYFDIEIISVVFNFGAALATLLFMQVSTCEAGLFTRQGVLKLGHRLLFAAMAVGFAINAGETVVNDTAPRPVDLLLQVILFGVLAVSARRHLLNHRQRAAVESRHAIQ